jgi:hypothetical protein
LAISPEQEGLTGWWLSFQELAAMEILSMNSDSQFVDVPSQ